LLLSPKATILVVDDNEQVCSLMARVLREEGGYEVVEAHSGAEALGVLAIRPQLQLLITDVVMPGLNGFDLASHVVAARNVPVLLVSAHSLTGSDIPGPVLQKPFTAEALLDLVGRLLALAGPSPKQPA
jgi:CheY-like chemotaxis protein